MLCQIDSFPHVRREAHDACEYKSYLVKLLCSFMDIVFTGSYLHTIVSESCISLHMTGHTGLSSKIETHNRCFHKGKLLTLVMSVQWTTHITATPDFSRKQALHTPATLASKVKFNPQKCDIGSGLQGCLLQCALETSRQLELELKLESENRSLAISIVSQY